MSTDDPGEQEKNEATASDELAQGQSPQAQSEKPEDPSVEGIGRHSRAVQDALNSSRPGASFRKKRTMTGRGLIAVLLIALVAGGVLRSIRITSHRFNKGMSSAPRRPPQHHPRGTARCFTQTKQILQRVPS
jgi:hypothetical protein